MIIIIGAGPNGLYLYFRLKNKFKDKKIIIVDKDSIVGNLKKYPNLLWHSTWEHLYLDNIHKNTNCPTTNELIKYYEKFCIENKINVVINEVIDIVKNNDDYRIIFKDNTEIYSKYVILCNGIYTNPNKLKIKDNYNFVKYNFPDNHLKNKKLVLVGAKNSATDYITNFLPNNKIYWIIRGNTIPVESSFLEKYKDNIVIYLNTEIKNFDNDNSIELTNNEYIKNIDECNILIGYNPKNKLLMKIGLNFNDYNDIIVNKNYESNKKNIYIFGSLLTNIKDNIPIYIHNGNPKIANTILDDISKKEKMF